MTHVMSPIPRIQTLETSQHPSTVTKNNTLGDPTDLSPTLLPMGTPRTYHRYPSSQTQQLIHITTPQEAVQEPGTRPAHYGACRPRPFATVAGRPAPAPVARLCQSEVPPLVPPPPPPPSPPPPPPSPSPSPLLLLLSRPGSSGPTRGSESRLRPFSSAAAAMKWMFKEDHSLEHRCVESAKIRAKYPDRVPVIVEKVSGSQIVDIDKRKYLVPSDITVAQFMWIIRKRIQLPSEKAIFLFVDKTVPQSSLTMGQLYEKEKDEDGFLYVAYSGENTFGF
uniref:Gamma-aminobutyric acid receptor-associated protein-like 2 n=1 Tax=Monodelphis domestica TaxID=13616 RepID=F7GE54_MONDO